jgi:hypothetical protein
VFFAGGALESLAFRDRSGDLTRMIGGLEVLAGLALLIACPDHNT